MAIPVTDGFEQIELEEPRKALEKTGAVTSVVSPKEGRVRGWKFTEWGDEVPIDADRSRECRCRVVNRPIVVDDNLLTTRQPGDIAEAFNPGMIDLFRSSARAGVWGTA